MSIKLNPFIEKLSWEEASPLIQPVNPEFAELVNNLELPPGCEIFKVRYLFGEYILEDGSFLLPNELGEPTPITDPSTPRELQEKFAHAPSAPMGMSVNKCIDIYLMSGERIVPIVACQPGNIFALTGVLIPEASYDDGARWYLSAGSRMVFSTSKISETRRYDRVNRVWKTGAHPPSDLLEHWETFKEMAKSPLAEKSWACEVLFFTKEWFTSEETYSGLKIQNYLYKSAWKGSSYFRNHCLRDSIFSRIESLSNIRAEQNTLNCARHLIAIGAGALPGLSFGCDEKHYPKSHIQKVLVEDYKIDYAPTMMALKYLSNKAGDTVYYVLQIPTVVDFDLRNKDKESHITELRRLSHIMDKIIKRIRKEELSIQNPDFPVTKGVTRAKYEFFHRDPDAGHGILPATELPTHDSDLAKELLKYKDLPFCSVGRLQRGIVKITRLRKK